MTTEYVSRSAEETFGIGRTLAGTLRSGSICAFSGDLGSGKTCMIKGICSGLGVTDTVNSPTFTIINIYGGGVLPVYHFDLYRIGAEEELQVIGYEDYVFGNGISLIEWAEKAPHSFGHGVVSVVMEIIGATERRVTVSCGSL